MATADIRTILLANLTDRQRSAVSSTARRLLVIAGAGSGKTEVMARRIAWWVGVEGVPKEAIVAFTFTERAAEEMKFRIRKWIGCVTPEGGDATLGGMYVGTIHGFCTRQLRELRPDAYHNYDVIDELARVALVERGYYAILGLRGLESALGVGKHRTIETFLRAYDLLNEYDVLDMALPDTPPPHLLRAEDEWCKQARLLTDVGEGEVARAFATSAARLYAYLRCRRFLDFSTSQSEAVRMLRNTPALLERAQKAFTHLVVDEVQDTNLVQDSLVRMLVGEHGTLTAVGDHRQAIFGWRGGKVDIMARTYEELRAVPEGAGVVDLTHNFRSTPRIINLANRWAESIGAVRSMATPPMEHGRSRRIDFDPSHVAALEFPERAGEAEWIANAIARLVNGENGMGAAHDTDDGERGLTYADIAILVRSSTDARTYTTALHRRGIPVVFRAGPDLFSQPEVLLFLAAMAYAAGVDEFMGWEGDPKSLPRRLRTILDCEPEPRVVIRAACRALREQGLALLAGVEDRIVLAAELLRRRIGEMKPATADEAAVLHNPDLAEWVTNATEVRRVFPQEIFQMLLREADAAAWDEDTRSRAATAMFHLGQFSGLVRGIETPGWTSPYDFKFQMIALSQWGAKNARIEEAPLLVAPDAVTISTIHGAKGLEWAAVFVADVAARRFPSSSARRAPVLPFDGAILDHILPSDLADNGNYDSERRLMYVALTRAERYLFVSRSGREKSTFVKSICPMIAEAGGTSHGSAAEVPSHVRCLRSHARRDFRLVTSFSDLRYYLECPHDFYLRKVLGFAAGVDEAFGYGRGVHNILRAIHSDPARWAGLAADPAALRSALDELVSQGLFYLRYTTGSPADALREHAIGVIADYVRTYAGELATLRFEPERQFETLLEEASTLVAGAVDVIRLDDPPRVTLIDFKSGDAKSDAHAALDEDLMKLQVSIYGLAARRELEYEPDRGFVRYLAETDPDKRELTVDLSPSAMQAARSVVVEAAGAIQARRFRDGPTNRGKRPASGSRCATCDYLDVCGLDSAKQQRDSERKRRRSPRVKVRSANGGD